MKRNFAILSQFVAGGLALLLVQPSFAQPPEPEVGETREYTHRGFLCEGSNGVVRPGATIAVLGMFGQMASHTETRLSTNLARRFAPLVSRVEWLKNSIQPQVFYGGGTFGVETSSRAHMSVAEVDRSLSAFTGIAIVTADAVVTAESIPTILMELRVKSRLVKKLNVTKHENFLGRTESFLEPHLTYEIQQAELVQAEQLSPEFLGAWVELDRTLHEIVGATLEPSTPAKRQRVTNLIEEGSRALNTMLTQPITPAFRDTVRAIEPKAHVTRRFQFEGPRQWREQLELYSAKLGIAPKTPLPVRKEYPIAKWIQESESLEAMLRTVRAVGDDDVWLQRIPYPVYWYRNGTTSYNLPLSALPNLASADFERLRDAARKPGAKFVTNSPTANSDLADPTKPITSAQLGVVLKPADTNLLMRHLLLAGWVVDERLPDGPDKGLAPGDLLPGYNSVYDVVMSSWEWSLRRAINLGEQKVFRGDKVFTVQGAK